LLVGGKIRRKMTNIEKRLKIGYKTLFLLFSSFWFMKEREIFAGLQHRKKRSLFSYITATKLAYIDVLKFYLKKVT
jgi:hypothetical protein